jgi:hypothetical protein
MQRRVRHECSGRGCGIGTAAAAPRWGLAECDAAISSGATRPVIGIGPGGTDRADGGVRADGTRADLSGADCDMLPTLPAAPIRRRRPHPRYRCSEHGLGLQGGPSQPTDNGRPANRTAKTPVRTRLGLKPPALIIGCQRRGPDGFAEIKGKERDRDVTEELRQHGETRSGTAKRSNAPERSERCRSTGRQLNVGL